MLVILDVGDSLIEITVRADARRGKAVLNFT